MASTQSENETISEAESLVELAEVAKEYEDVRAVDGIDLTIRRGEFFSLVGPSGCGKTTTLRIISGFEQPTEGQVRLNGRDITDVPPDQRNTNLVFQHLALFPHMTVMENIEYGLKKAGASEQTRREKATTYLELVDLDGLAERRPAELSGGQQQRVALARALANEPSVLLLDEPLASLDRKLRKQMRVELRTIHEQTQGAFMYVTHDQETAMTLSDRLAVMNDGRIEQVGTPEEIYNSPATQFVAEFIGDTNILPGSIVTQNGTRLVQIGAQEGQGFTLRARPELPTGEVTVCVRPNDITPTTASGMFTGTIRERYFQGETIKYVVEPDLVDIDTIDVAVANRGSPLARGAHAAFEIEDERVVVFPASS